MNAIVLVINSKQCRLTALFYKKCLLTYKVDSFKLNLYNLTIRSMYYNWNIKLSLKNTIWIFFKKNSYGIFKSNLLSFYDYYILHKDNKLNTNKNSTDLSVEFKFTKRFLNKFKFIDKNLNFLYFWIKNLDFFFKNSKLIVNYPAKIVTVKQKTVNIMYFIFKWVDDFIIPSSNFVNNVYIKYSRLSFIVWFLNETKILQNSPFEKINNDDYTSSDKKVRNKIMWSGLKSLFLDNWIYLKNVNKLTQAKAQTEIKSFKHLFSIPDTVFRDRLIIIFNNSFSPKYKNFYLNERSDNLFFIKSLVVKKQRFNYKIKFNFYDVYYEINPLKSNLISLNNRFSRSLNNNNNIKKKYNYFKKILNLNSKFINYVVNAYSPQTSSIIYKNYIKYLSFFFYSSNFFFIEKFTPSLFTSRLKTHFYNHLNEKKYKNTNVFPDFLFKKAVFEEILSLKIKDSLHYYNKYLNIYIIDRFSDFFKKNVLLLLSSNLNFNYQPKWLFIGLLHKKVFFMQKFLGRSFPLKQLFEILYVSFKSKDLDLFIDWFIELMNNLEPKKHRKFIYFLKLIICKYFTKISQSLQLRGFYLRIAGKISVTGNAKTRAQYIRWGAYGFSKKDNRLELRRGIVRTNTGALGVTIVISY